MGHFTTAVFSRIFDFDLRQLTTDQRAEWDRRARKAFDMDDTDHLDVHALMAWRIYGCAPAEATAAQRRHAKQVNFLMLYGAERGSYVAGLHL